MDERSMTDAPLVYEAAGGEAGCRRIAEALYARIADDALLRPLFPRSFHCAIDAMAAFLTQAFGGPKEYSRTRYRMSLREAHRPFAIGVSERDAWVRCMDRALSDSGVDEPVRGMLQTFFVHAATDLINAGRDDACPACPAASGEDERPRNVLQERWRLERALDEIVAHIRAGDADRAIALMESAAVRDRLLEDSTAYVGLLALMIGSRDAAALAFVRDRLQRSPALVECRHDHGRTLLHDAAGAGDAPLVTYLVDLGADPNAVTDAGFTPLQIAANEGGTADVVAALVRAGALVDARGGIKAVTALHNAARRGNLSVAEALLDSGASLEIRDSQGETALRRAVNCAKADVAALLAARGADIHSRGSNGLTPIEAARSQAMRDLLCGGE